MDHFTHIYSHRASDYHKLIEPEDVDSNLLPALQRVTPLDGKRVLDLGTGTGRLPLLLDGLAAQVIGLDLHWDMLRENRMQRSQARGAWSLIQGDIRALPFATDWAEVITAGWAIGHLRNWYAENWQKQIGGVLREMHRVVAPGGALIIMETLTTGSTTPAPPTEALAEYYGWLESEWGFMRQTIRTDFVFDSVEAAVAHTEFFFGSDLSAAIQENGWERLPEWTGVWGKVLPGH